MSQISLLLENTDSSGSFLSLSILKKAAPKVLASQDVNEEVAVGVNDWQETIGEDMEDHAPDWRATLSNIF
jgi:hypothetical protein